MPETIQSAAVQSRSAALAIARDHIARAMDRIRSPHNINLLQTIAYSLGSISRHPFDTAQLPLIAAIQATLAHIRDHTHGRHARQHLEAAQHSLNHNAVTGTTENSPCNH